MRRTGSKLRHDDVAVDCTDCDGVAGQTQPVLQEGVCGTSVLVGSPDVGACRHARLQFFTGFSQVDSSGRPLHDVIKHTQIYVIRQLTYSAELLVCINHSKETIQTKKEENNSLNSTLLSLFFSVTLFFSVFLLSTTTVFY